MGWTKYRNKITGAAKAIAGVSLAPILAPAAILAAPTYFAYKGAQAQAQAGEAQAAAMRKQSEIADAQARRQRTAQIQAERRNTVEAAMARRKLASQASVASAFSGGGVQSSLFQGGFGGYQSQISAGYGQAQSTIGENLSFLDQTQSLAKQASAFNIRATELGAKASKYQGYGAVAQGVSNIAMKFLPMPSG